MPTHNRTEMTFFVGTLGYAAVAGIIFLIHWLTSKWQLAGAFCTVISALILVIVYMWWLGRRMDKVWAGADTTVEGVRLISVISLPAVRWLWLISVASFVLGLIWIALFAGYDYSTSLSPTIRIALSAIWFGYITVSISRLISTSENKADELTSFARNSIAAAIALSLYFLLPFDWITNNTRTFIVALEHGNAPAKIHTISPNPTIDWIQGTAIPTIISMAFGFLAAYVTSDVWYDYYALVKGAGIDRIDVSRKGRDPNKDDHWFNRLTDARLRVLLSGATLGGWFANWVRLRSALSELMSRESVQRITLILPDPGSAMFWARRSDELFRTTERSLNNDPISRLVRALETLYLCFPSDQSGANAVAEFLREKKLDVGDTSLANFVQHFEALLEKRAQAYSENKENDKFTNKLKAELAQDKNNRFEVVFTTGTLIGANIFDDTIEVVPYLPAVEDRNCPQLSVVSSSPLGTLILKSLEDVASDSVHVSTRSHVLAMIYRFWHQAQFRVEELKTLADIPEWLTISPEELQHRA